MEEKYLNINLDDEKFLDILNDHIKIRKPLSFTRFGDGEIYIINGNIPPVIAKRLREIWGYSDIEAARNNILKVLEFAIANTDIIGLMNPKNEIAKNINYTKEKWSLKESYVEKLRNKKDIIVADHMIARSQILGDINNFKKIIKGIDIAIIHPNVKLLEKNKIHELLGINIKYIETPNAMNEDQRQSLIKSFDNIKEFIVLYGCSINGKDFGVYLEKSGKIALDYGATLDAWAGLITRPWFKNGSPQNHCLIKNK